MNSRPAITIQLTPSSPALISPRPHASEILKPATSPLYPAFSSTYPPPMPAPSIDFYNAALDALQAGDLPTALSSAENSLTEDPADLETWQLYAMILAALGRHGEAAKARAKLAGLGLSHYDGLIMDAAEFLAKGDHQQAASQYKIAISEAPDRAEAHLGLAHTLMLSSKPAAAEVAARTAISRCPDDPRAAYTLGHILRLNGDKDQALAYLTRAIAAEPDLLIAIYEQGMIYAEKGRFREATENFTKFLETHPEDPSALQALSTVRTALGEEP